jgi:hypothetical protein
MCDQKCNNCDTGVWFCSTEHQWLHQDADNDAKCYPYRISTNERVGRHLVATEQIQPGALLFREDPIVVGNLHDTPPVCLGCLEQVGIKIFSEYYA